MKSQFVALAIVLAGLPALAWGQDCGCTSRVSMGRRPASYGAWADYQPEGCGGCAPACCDPCCRPLLCIIPNTVRKIGCALDCLLPCGPRSCTSRVSCGSGVSCSSGCPSCTGGVPVSDPFQDDLPAPPKPAPQETRYQKSVMAPRSVAAAPSAASKKSVLTRNTQRSDIDGGLRVNDEVSQANHVTPVVKKPASAVKRTSAQSSTSTRSASSIPHNPLR